MKSAQFHYSTPWSRTPLLQNSTPERSSGVGVEPYTHYKTGSVLSQIGLLTYREFYRSGPVSQGLDQRHGVSLAVELAVVDGLERGPAQGGQFPQGHTQGPYVRLLGDRLEQVNLMKQALFL